MSIVASKKIAPEELVQTLIQLNGAQMAEEPFGPLTLIVRAPAEEENEIFMRDLVACVRRDGPIASKVQGLVATSEFPTVSVKRGEPTEADQVELLSELVSAPHCVVPLRGQGRSLNVGRSPQSDIVLSDQSVSSSHARLSMESGGVRLSDEASKNGTRINGSLLLEGDKRWLQPMDRISFGRIHAFACDPRALRGVLRQDLRTLF